MNLGLPKNLIELKQHLHDPLFKNSIFIMLTSISSAGFGFFFWMLAAKLYPKEDVGIATALISSMALLVLLSRFGLGQSIIRFFPERDKGSVFGTSVAITTFFAVLFGIIFIAGIDTWSPQLDIAREYAPLYLIFLAASSIISLTGVSFIGIRRAEYYFFQSLLVGSRVIFLFPLVFLGALGIFSSVGVSFTLASLLSAFFLFRFGIKPSRMDREFLNDSLHFSAGNYIAGLLMTAPNQILPIMVLNILGAEETAHYYIAYAIASLLFMIPLAFSTSLFVEGSHGEALKKNTLKALFAIVSLLTPAMIILYLFGGFLLGIIGKSYVEGFDLLRIFAFSSFFVAICQLYFSIKKVQKDVKGLVFVSALIFVLITGLSYVFMLEFGIVGIGYAWMAGYGLGSLVVGGMVWREGWV
ncbi:MAG: oligosaccharide flippase family protein [Candidatus Syntrophoarchaeum sp.]|nr:oligosaccharide flippase family protein [Candidatus Syntrophoarchaeum sp.]